jgi:omega-6 fatty acid desaturase (delta-12 desaturase)
MAQLSGTVHCDYPRWVEILCHDINVHIPHHISTAIPSYNLRLAHRSLQQNWGVYLRECRFSWSLIKQITEQCHLYSSDRGYWSFKDHYRANTIAVGILPATVTGKIPPKTKRFTNHLRLLCVSFFD